MDFHTTSYDDEKMTPPTREQFLDHVHQPLINPQGDPLAGSPTKSTMRYRWRDLRDWDVEGEAHDYWDSLSDTDKHAKVVTRVNHWDSVCDDLDAFTQPFTSESTLRSPFDAAFRKGHNHAIKGASYAHAEIWGDAAGLEGEPPMGNSDLIFVYNNKLTGIIELKTWWKVNKSQIDDVRAGILKASQ